jgi:phosphoserine aminotransferase
VSDITYPADVAYLHLCSNNTIEGTQFKQFPDTGSVPLVADMTSDIASRRIDFTRFALFYAGAQKNLGPAGVTLVVVRDDFLATARQECPETPYKTTADSKSLYNTPRYWRLPPEAGVVGSRAGWSRGGGEGERRQTEAPVRRY